MKGVLTLLGCFVLSFSMAQNSISGKVTDAGDNTPVVGAIIYFHDLKRGAVTDVNGHYIIPDLPKGNFLLECTYIGYSAFVKSIQINGATELDMILSGGVTELNEVVVTGMSHSSELKSNPIPVATIDNRALTENSST